MARKPKKVVQFAKRVLQGILMVVLGYVLALVGMILWTFEVRLSRWPVLIYAAPFGIQVGDEITKISLFARLRRLGYSSSPTAIPEPGQWHRSGTEISLCLRHSPIREEGIVSGLINLTVDWDRISSIRLMRSLEEVNRVTLEPELIHVIPGTGYDAELCRPVPLDKVPPLLVDAVLLTEDERFFSHSGIDLGSIRRALGANWKAGRYVQGGSTISQQLIRMTLLNPEKTIMRKFNEVCLSLVAEALYRKQTILEAYLNRVYLGQQGAYPVRGVAEAARTLFGKDLAELDAAECAFIAATIRAPNVIHPQRHPGRARDRRNMVLARLFKAGKIARDLYEEAVDAPVHVNKTSPTTIRAAAFIELVRDQLPAELPGTQLGTLRQDVLTSLDPLIQSESEMALRPLAYAAQAHLILADTRSGGIRALISPTGPQKWSGAGGDLTSMLPFLIIPALSTEKQDAPKYTLTSQVLLTGRPEGSLTLRRAFVSDPGALTNRLVGSISQNRIIDTLKEFGIRAGLSGDQGVTVLPVTALDMAHSYCLLATLGNSGPLNPGLKIVDSPPAEEREEPKRAQVNPAAMFLVNHLLKGWTSKPELSGTHDSGQAQPSLFTTTDKEGLWSIAYRDEVVLVLRVPGLQWDRRKVEALMKRLLPETGRSGEPPPPPPEGVMFRAICLDSGLRATSLCPRVIREPFMRGTQPVEWCPLRHESETIRSNGRK